MTSSAFTLAAVAAGRSATRSATILEPFWPSRRQLAFDELCRR